MKISEVFLGEKLLLSLLLWLPLSVASSAHAEILLVKSQTIYVPAYSEIFHGDKNEPYLLAVTLSIRNANPNKSMEIDSVEYYNSTGKLVRAIMTKPKELTALASEHFFIKESDISGGIGASFLVRWHAKETIVPPVIESIMVSTRSGQGISFVSRGSVIKEEK